MKKLVLLCLFVLTTTNVMAKCGDDSLPQDTNYKYFMGKGYSDKSAEDAIDKAEQDFNSQITRLFGVLMDTQSEYYSDETSVSGTSRTKERSLGNIRIKGLDKFDEPKTTRENGSYIGYVCYKYPIKEYETEKIRLENIKLNDKTNYIFNETYGDTDCIGSSVSIITNPGKALVIIDDGKYQGETPIKFGNICNGKHKLFITKDNYKDVSETLIVPSSNIIEKTLAKDSKEIKIKTNVGNARIFINGIDRGIEPVKFNAIFGDNYEIEVKSDEAIQEKKTRIFYKDSPDTLEIKMEKKAANLDFSALKKLNPNIQIYIDDEELKGNRKNLLLADYKYNLKFKKDGFYDIEDTITLKGGETKYYPAKRLKFSKTPTKTMNSFFGLGGSIGNGIHGIDLLHLGFDYKYKYLYVGGGLNLLNYLYLPKAKMEFDYKELYFSSHHIDVELPLLYKEYAYLNLGFNINFNYSIFGSVAFGQLNYDTDFLDAEVDLGYGLYMSEHIKSIIRYGIGFQYFPSNKKKEENKFMKGIRITYMTGNTNVTLDDIKIHGFIDTPVTPQNANFEFPKKISSLGITFLFGF